MKILFYTGAFVCAAITAEAQNRIEITQIGINNMQATVQTGTNSGMVVQLGADNEVSLTQTGENNVAAIAQIGEGHERTVVQDGHRLGYGSIQADSTLTGTFSQTGGNAYTSTTGVLEVN